MTDLRKLARGQPCLVRLPGCDGGGETTVLAHFRTAGLCGIGFRGNDLATGAWACYNCHEICDSRIAAPDGMTKDEVRLAHAIGVMRTITELVRMGALWEGKRK